MVAVIDKLMPQQYFSPGLLAPQADQVSLTQLTHAASHNTHSLTQLTQLTQPHTTHTTHTASHIHPYNAGSSKRAGC